MTVFEILLTRGISERRLVKIDIRKTDVYVIFRVKGRNYHWSYHESGTIWETIPGHPATKIATGPAYDKFKGFFTIFAAGFQILDLNEARYWTPRRKSIKNSLNLYSVFKQGFHAGISIHLVERNRMNLVNGFVSKNKVLTYNLIQDVNPWILVTVIESGAPQITTGPYSFDIPPDGSRKTRQVTFKGRVIRDGGQKVLTLLVDKIE